MTEKFALVGDIHIADRPPSIRTETYTDDILAKVEFIATDAKARGCTSLVSLGDVFHLKTPTRNSHALVQRLHTAMTSAGLEWIICPGNHDVSYDRLDSLPKQPLGSLGRMGGITILEGPHHQFPIFSIPWLHDWSNELPRWMSRYRKWADEKKADDFDFWPLLITHAPIFPPGEEPPYEFIPGDEWARLMQKGDAAYGHIHDPHGVYRPTDEVPVTLSNNGAISRGSIHEATLKRKPVYTIWYFNPGGFEVVDIPHRPVEAVFRLFEKEDADEQQSRVTEFLEHVGSTTLDGLSIEEVVHTARQRGLSERTLALVEDLLEQV